MENKNKMSIKEHKKVAARLSEIMELIDDIHNTVSKPYGEKSEELILNIKKSLGALRSFLDVRVFIENPGRNGNDNAKIYFSDHGCKKEKGENCEKKCNEKECHGHG